MQDDFEISKEFNLPQEETKKMKLNKNLIGFLGVGIIILLVLGFFGYQYIAPFGTKVMYQFTSDKNSDMASGLLGANKSGTIETNAINSLIVPQQTIRNNIVTFNLKLLSKKIDGIWINLKFKGNPKEIKIGVKGSEKENYQYLPLYNQILNSLSWSQAVSGKTTLWQREKKYKNIFELVSNPPVGDQLRVASYFYNFSDIVMQENNSSPQSNLKIEKTLRGTHTLLVKVNKKPLLLTVAKQDANSYKGKDELLIQIYNGQNKIAEQLIPDDGVTDDNGLMMTSQKGEIKINDIKPGVYTMVIKDTTGNADIRIKSIEINQPSLVFKAPVFVVDEKPTTLWTNSKKIMMRTQHILGVQTVRLDSKYNLKIEIDDKNFEFDLTNPESKIILSSANTATTLHKLEIPKNDLSINGDGYFAFSEKSFFNPEPIKTVDLSTVTDISKIDYIIANYQKVKKDGDWKIAQVYFDPKDINIEKDKLYFSLESPGLAQSGGEIAISSLEVTVDKPGWFNSSAASNQPSATSENKDDKGLMMNTWNTIASPFVGAWHGTAGFFGSVWNGTTGFFGGVWDSTANFFGGFWPFKTENNESGIKNNAEPSEAPANTPTPTPSLKDKLKITIQNGGGVAGAAAKYADLLKNAGFKNVEAVNAPSASKNVTISFNKDQEKELDSVISEIETLLNKDYEIVNKKTDADTDKINILLGEIPKPSPTETPASGSATTKP